MLQFKNNLIVILKISTYNKLQIAYNFRLHNVRFSCRNIGFADDTRFV